MSPSAILLILWGVVLLISMPAVLRRLGLERANFRGERIPTAYGLAILLWLALAFTLWLSESGDYRVPLASLAAVVGFGTLGFIDDKWGDRRNSGLRGHLQALLVDGRITTGLAKAVGGSIVAVVAATLVFPGDAARILLSGLVIALSANAFNLLDLRPGRACAVFIVSAVGLVLASREARPAIYAVIPAALAFPQDAAAKVMLGDTGSNLLGGILGLSLVLAVPSHAGLLAVLAVLAALHVVSERWSLSEIIERNPLLRALDAMTGVRGSGKPKSMGARKG